MAVSTPEIAASRSKGLSFFTILFKAPNYLGASDHWEYKSHALQTAFPRLADAGSVWFTPMDVFSAESALFGYISFSDS